MKKCETPNIKWTYFKGMNPYMIFRKKKSSSIYGKRDADLTQNYNTFSYKSVSKRSFLMKTCERPNIK